MKMMTKRQYEAKLYLDKVRNVKKEVDIARQKVEEYESYVMSVKSMFGEERVDTGKYKKNTIDEKVIKLIEKKDALTLLEKKLEDAKKEIKCLIDSIADKNIMNILYYRYVCLLTWEEIADKMNYKKRWSMTLHMAGLDRISELIE